MSTNNYIAKLKLRLDQAIIQREHWKQLAENRNSILVTEVCPESRSVEEHIVDADNVRASRRLMREYREQIEALRKRARTAEREAAQALRTLKGLEKVAKVVDANSDQVCGENNLLRQEVEALRAERDELREELSGVKNVSTETAKAMKRLVMYARTSGGTAGPDAGLMDACEQAEKMLSLGGIGRAYMEGADATQAPEVPDHIENALTMVDQGGRQEAVAIANRGKCAFWVKWTDAAEGLYGPGIKLYTTPQPSQDVRGLVEALEWYEQQAAGCRKLTSEGDECRQALDSDGGKRAQTALAAHRQTQRQGDSHE